MLRRNLVSAALVSLALVSSARSQPETPAPLQSAQPAEFRVEFRQPEWREQNFYPPNATDEAKKFADKASALGYEIHLENLRDRSRVAWRMTEWSPFATLYKAERAQQVRTWLEEQGVETRLGEQRPSTPPPTSPTGPDPRALVPPATPNFGRQFWPPGIVPPTAGPLTPERSGPPGAPGFLPSQDSNRSVRPNDPAFNFPPPLLQDPRGFRLPDGSTRPLLTPPTTWGS
jgi:hypothetical protein